MTDITASLNGVSGKTTITVTPATLVAIAITPTNPSVAKGTLQQFTATGTFSDSSIQNLSAQVTWTSSDKAVATLNSQGLATSLSPGTTTISAAMGGTSGSTVLTVTAATLVSIAVTPTSPTIANGTLQQFTATGTYTDSSTQNLTALVTWASSDLTIAVISNGTGSQGLAIGGGVGTTTISAAMGGTRASTALTVTAATLVSIAVTPTSPTLAKGTSQQFTATGTYTDSSTQNLTPLVMWASSDLTIAAISNAAGAQGLATGGGVGTTTISAAMGGKSGSTALTVTAATLVSIAVTPTSPAIAKGTPQQFTATGTYTDSSTQNLTPLVTWASSAVTIAAISNAAGSQGLATGTGVGSTTISATLGGKSGNTALSVTAATLVSIAVTPTSPAIAKGTPQQFTATGTYTDSATQNLTALVTWASSDGTIAAISNAAGSQGLATGGGVGSTTISATLGGKSGSTVLSVTAATLVSIAVTPTSPAIVKGTPQQFTAMGTYTDSSTQNLTALCTWASSDGTIAAISNAAGSQGLATAGGVGSTTISATLGGKSGSTVLSVTAATLVFISVMPTSPAIAKGTPQQFTATGTYTDSSTQDLTALCTWTSSDLTIAAISNAAGSQGLATGTGVGSTTISATLGGKSGRTALSVTAATLAAIAVTPTSPAIAKGTPQQFTATGTYTDGSTQNLTLMVTWASSDGTIAAISNAAGSQGLATGGGVGSTTISATLGGKSGSTALSVTAATLVSIAVTPTSASIAKGTNQQFTATGTYTDSSTQNLTPMVTWASTDLTIAAISNAAGSQGLATGTGVGTTTISAALGGKSGSTALTVTAATLSSIAVTPTSLSIAKSTAQQFTATGTYTDSSTQNLTLLVTWASSDATIAAISNAAGSRGLATGIGVGTITISATLSGMSGSTVLFVTAPSVVSIAVTPTSATIAKGTSQQFTAKGTYTDGSSNDITALVTWACSDLTLATVSNAAGSQGLATGIKAGLPAISATLGGKTGSASLKVTAATVVSISLLPTNPSIVKGTNQRFTATGTFDDASTQDITSGVTWASSDSTLAPVSNAAGAQGLVTGVKAGTATISATLGGKSGSTGVVVWAGFAAATTYAAGSNPNSVAAGDFNRDGKLDLVIVNTGSSSVSVLLATGTGGFTPAVNFAVGSTPFSVAVGDFNGDGKPDLATANVSSSNVSVLLGTGTGGFTPAVNFAIGGSPFSVAVGDFNGDSKLDLVTANYGLGEVSVLLGTGTGSFAAAVHFPVGGNPTSVAVGDFNGDSKLDVATTINVGVSVLLGDGTGRFGTAVPYSDSSNAYSAVIGDFNGDSKLDVATVDYVSNIASVLLGTGTGRLGTAVSFSVGAQPRGMAVGDLNGDGKLDMVTANTGTAEVSVLLGDGSGSFTTARNFSVGGSPQGVAVGDFNGDGKLDLATANGGTNSVTVLLSQ